MLVSAGHAGQNLLVNGSFDNEEGPFYGWVQDFRWSGNDAYADNHTRVVHVAREGVRRDVVRITPPVELDSKMESEPIPFDPEAKYTCTLRVKGGPYRVSLIAYKWEPGVRPHDKPVLGELRRIYKGKAKAGASRNWSEVKVELSMEDASSTGRRYLSRARYFTVLIIALGMGEGVLYVDDVVVEAD
jgi:hypothetical protein